MKWFASARLSVVLLSSSLPVTEPPRPNVIVIMADDLGYRDLGCYGHGQIRTPVLDKLATGGMRLTNFHSGATVCTPSRMALTTGAYPVRLGWTKGVIGYLIADDEGMNPQALTMAEVFASEGYATGLSGKWHMGSGPATGSLVQGFEEAYHIKLSNNQTRQVWRGETLNERPYDNRLLTERFTEAAVRFIRTQQKKPFFLYLPYTAPHFPVEAHPNWKGRSSFGEYGDVVEELDHRIGEIVKVLEELGERENTLIIFTSDNGPQANQQARATPFRGAKWSALEGGTRVPCIINWPAGVAAGRESDKLVASIDLLPSLSRACRIDLRAKSMGQPKIDGLDVWETLAGGEGKHARRSLLHWQGKSPEPIAVTFASWKLFFNGRDAVVGDGTFLGSTEQLQAAARLRAELSSANRPVLFHLTEDAGETLDVAEQYPEKVKELLEVAASLKAGLAASEPLPLTKSHN